jgi:hypothetical protein
MIDTVGERAAAASRLFLSIGENHFGVNSASQLDLIALITDWVQESNEPPRSIVAVSFDAMLNVSGSRLVCDFPNYPKYIGPDPNSVHSFRCTPFDE